MVIPLNTSGAHLILQFCMGMFDKRASSRGLKNFYYNWAHSNFNAKNIGFKYSTIFIEVRYWRRCLVEGNYSIARALGWGRYEGMVYSMVPIRDFSVSLFSRMHVK